MEYSTIIINNFVTQAYGVKVFTLQDSVNDDFYVKHILHNFFKVFTDILSEKKTVAKHKLIHLIL